MIIDTHIHLAGTGCCDSQCWISPRFRRRYTFQLLKILQKISNRQMRTTVDQDWAERVATMVVRSQADYGVVLGFDGHYHPSTGRFDESQSQMLIPPSWVFKVCQEHPSLLPGPSVHPAREDIDDRLAECMEGGAVLIKWLPAAQGIDPSLPRYESFYEKVAAANIPLLIHMGGERTFASIAPELNDVERLRLPLQLGVKVICAHSATRLLGTKEPNQIPQLKNLLTEFPNLWLDNSGLCNPGRFSHVPVLAQDPQITQNTLYGSDWPVPSNAIYYWRQLGSKTVTALEKEPNPITRDIEIKRNLGYPDDTLTRAPKVLANLHRWVPSIPSDQTPSDRPDQPGKI